MGTTDLGFWAFLPGQPPSSHTYPTLKQPFLGKLQTQTQPQLVSQNGPHHLLLVASFCQQESYGPGWGSDLPKIRQLQRDQKTLALPSGSVLFPCLYQCWFLSLAHNGNYQSSCPVQYFGAHQSATGFNMDPALCRVHFLVYKHFLISFYGPGSVLDAKDEKRGSFCFQEPQLTVQCDYFFSIVGLCISSFIQRLLNIHVSGTATDAENTELIKALPSWKL